MDFNLTSILELGGPGDIDFEPVWTHLKPRFAISPKVKESTIPMPLCHYPGIFHSPALP